jgi:hypothetical protein
MAAQIVEGKYRHYKGNDYLVIGIAKHSETLEDHVVYKALYGDRETWIRPASMFFETVQVNGSILQRFTKIDGEHL